MRTVLIILLFALVGCDRREHLEELTLPAKNPTSYEFGFSLARTKEGVRRGLVGTPSWHIEFASDSSIVWGETILRKPENAHDAYVEHMGQDTSRIFIWRKGRGAPYFVQHHIHLEVLAENRTRVDVIAVNPRITIGARFPYYLPYVPSVPDAAITRKVPPSTIEEYEILLKIGRALGVEQEMPKLILPEAHAKGLER